MYTNLQPLYKPAVKLYIIYFLGFIFTLFCVCFMFVFCLFIFA